MVNPSSYKRLKDCPLSCAWDAEDDFSSLMSYPSGLLGSIIHKLIERRTRGQIEDTSRSCLEAEWENIKEEIILENQSNWINQNVLPLEKTVKGYMLRKMLTFKTCAGISPVFSRSGSGEGERKTGAELWIGSPDGKAGGYVDRIERTDQGYCIQDYKTGTIVQDDAGTEGVVKEDYQIQLKLYAAIFNEQHGEWPQKLLLLQNGIGSQEVSYSHEEASALLREAKELLEVTNEMIDEVKGGDLSLLANPSPDNCRFCNYRHVCDSYWKARRPDDVEDWPHDIIGEFINYDVQKNGKILLSLKSKESEAIITIGNLSSSEKRHPAIYDAQQGDIFYCMDLGKRNTDGPLEFREHGQKHASFSKTVLFRKTS